MAEDILSSGKAYRKMIDIINAQGARATDPDKIEVGKLQCDVKANKSGTIRHIDNKLISKIAWSTGAPIDKGAGMFMHKHVGDKVKKGDTLYTLYSDSDEKLEFAKKSSDEQNPIIIG
jgi:thymidine phosphorylase